MTVGELRKELPYGMDDAEVYMMTSDMRISEKKPIIGSLQNDKTGTLIIIGAATAGEELA